MNRPGQCGPSGTFLEVFVLDISNVYMGQSLSLMTDFEPGFILNSERSRLSSPFAANSVGFLMHTSTM